MSVLQKITERVRPNPANLPVVLELDLARGVLTHAPTSPIEALKQRTATTLRDIREGLAHAEKDDHVVGLAVHIGTAPLPLGDADEVAELIAAFTKPTIAWTETFGELSGHSSAYRIACAADEIWLQPTGTVGFSGFHASMTLFRGTLEKVGVTPHFEQRKEYKSAAETFGGREISDANREQTQRLVDSLLEHAIGDVASARNLDEDTVRGLVDQSPIGAEQALEAGLIDHVGYRDEVYTAMRERWGTERHTRGDDRSGEVRHAIHPSYVNRYNQRAQTTGRLSRMFATDRSAIGVVSAIGNIVLGPSTPGVGGTPCGCDTLSAQLRSARHDDSVQAVVLRVDSGGGSAVGSDQVRREVLQLREAGKPVVASMGNVAASGGYFIAMGTDRIVANPSTITGSIGVLGGKFILAGLHERIGLVREGADAGARAGMWSEREFTDDELDVLNAWLDEVYSDFTTKAAQDRGMSIDELEPLARGRVWTGADAAERGLVDHVGGLATALRVAAEHAGAKPGELAVRTLPQMPWLDQLRPPESSETHASAVGWDLGPDGLFRAAARMLGMEAPAGVLSLPWTPHIRS